MAVAARRAESRAVLLARVRIPLMVVGTALLVLGGYVGVPLWARILAFLPCLLVYLRVGRLDREPYAVRPPVAGRWMALNSPADRVPSHGLHAYGQTYAIDLVHEPAPGARPDIGWYPLTRPPGDFPAFGQPVYAPADGVVVRTRARQRDHRSRNSWPWLFGLVVEGALRELRGPTGLLGNHVVIDLGDGTHALLAHLRRGSVRVRAGDRVRCGQHIADCGNSGNSSEPHVHFQLMDHPRAWLAAGLPFRWERFTMGGQPREGVPEAWRPFTV